MQRIHFEDLHEGDVLRGDAVLADPEETMAYDRLNDPWPIHVHEAFAARSPFGGVIASGGCTVTLTYRSPIGLFDTPERRWEFLGGLDWKVRFAKPVRPGGRLRARLTVLETRPSSRPGRGVVRDLTEMIDQDGDAALSVEVVFLLATRPDGAPPARPAA